MVLAGTGGAGVDVIGRSAPLEGEDGISPAADGSEAIVQY